MKIVPVFNNSFLLGNLFVYSSKPMKRRRTVNKMFTVQIIRDDVSRKYQLLLNYVVVFVTVIIVVIDNIIILCCFYFYARRHSVISALPALTLASK
jgi:hypothetical protein